MGQHAMPLLLGVEEVGERHYLALEGGEFAARLAETLAVERPPGEHEPQAGEPRHQRRIDMVTRYEQTRELPEL